MRGSFDDGGRVFVVVADSQSEPGGLISTTALDVLRASGTVRFLDLHGRSRTSAMDLIAERAADANALIFTPWSLGGFGSWDGAVRLAPACWELMPSLRAIAGTFDNRFELGFGESLADMHARGIAVIDTSRSMTPLVAEFALLMILNLLRGVPDAVAAVRRGEFPAGDPQDVSRGGWEYEEGFIAGELTGRSVGLAGFGVINRRLAELLRPFRCSLATSDPFVDDDVLRPLGVRRATSLAELAAASEVFVVGIPPTPATVGLIDHRVIDALPRGALVVLVTRMAVVEQEALWRRVAGGEVRAAVDVYRPEPPAPDAAFRTDPNVLPTPHMAGSTLHAHRRCFYVACEEAANVAAGARSELEMTDRDAAIYGGHQSTPVDRSDA